VQVQINLADLSSAGSFVLGLYDGAITDAAGVSQVTLNVTENGQMMVMQNYSGAGAVTAFTDGVPMLSEAGFTNSGTATVKVSLTVTTTAAGAGFSGDFIFGDPPQAAMALAKPEMSFLSPPANAARLMDYFAPFHTSAFFGRAVASAGPAGGMAAPIQREVAGSFGGFDAAALQHGLPGSLPIPSAAHFSGLFGFI
jgi:hypothetical protein